MGHSQENIIMDARESLVVIAGTSLVLTGLSIQDRADGIPCSPAWVWSYLTEVHYGGRCRFQRRPEMASLEGISRLQRADVYPPPLKYLPGMLYLKLALVVGIEDL